MTKPQLSFWQIWNMSFGFLGIQFGWGLQMANMSAIYEYLGAKPDEIPLLWLAAPLTGLLVQPIVGHLSDRTWSSMGRRRPYFLTGAILASGALILMPNSSALWMAAGLLWVLDASINISMEPFRAFVSDMLPEDQRAQGFSMQSVFIGLGAVIASALPWIFAKFGVSAVGSAAEAIPQNVRLSFYVGAVALLGAVLWTVFTTREYPPEDIDAFARKKKETAGIFSGLGEIIDAVRHMPSAMKQLAWVQVFSWLGLFCMWLYFGVAIARSVFGAPDERSPLYGEGIAWAGICFATYSAVCFAFAFALPRLAHTLGPKVTHALCLVAGGIGLLSVGVIRDPYVLLLSMVGVGIAWASILSMPYVMISSSIPAARMGTYMGIFNFFIVLPEIFVALALGKIMNSLLGNNRVAAVVAGGLFFFVAAALSLRVRLGNESTVAAGQTPAPLGA